jgi:hypothetical protein
MGWAGLADDLERLEVGRLQDVEHVNDPSRRGRPTHRISVT